MANVKITELTAATALAGTDVLPIVDVGADATKKVSVSDLLRNLPDGSAASPSLAFADDQNTGVLSPGNNSLAFATSGTQRLVIDSSGNVAIGHTSADGRLHVRKDGTGEILQIWQSDLGTNNRNCQLKSPSSDSASEPFTFATANSFAVQIDSSERFRINAAGNVGIGTSSPNATLHTAGTRDYTGTSPGLSSYDNNFVSGTAVVSIGQSNGCPSIQGHGSGTAFNLALAPNNGKVGIGTTSPSQLLDISSSGNAITRMNSGSATTTGVILSRGGTEVARITSAATGVLAFSTGSSASERLRIDGSGHVMIGSTTDFANINSDDLQVGNTGNANTGITIGSSSQAQIAFADSGDSRAGVIHYQHTDNSLRFMVNGAANERLRINDSGRVGIGTSSIDERLHVEGSGTNERVKIENTTSNIAGLVMLNTSRRYDVQVNGSDLQVYDNTGSAERLRIDSSGRLKIGTTSISHGTVNLSGSFFLSDLGTNNRGLKIYEESDTVAASGTSSDFFYNTHGGGLCQITVQRTSAYTNQATALYFAVGKGLGGSPTMTQVVGFTNGQGGITTPTVNTATGKFTITNNDANEVRIVVHYFFNKQN